MEKHLCGECEREITDPEPLQCGFCDAFLHINQACCGVNSRSLKEAFALGKLMLLCSKCRGELNGRSVRSYIADTFEQQQQQVPPAPLVSQSLIDLPAQVQQLSDAVAALNTKIDKLPGASAQLSWPTPNTPTWPRGPKRRRVDENTTVSAPSDRGTNSIDLSDLSVSSVAPTAVDKFWLYLSGLNPLVTGDDLQKIVSRCLSVPGPVDLVRLVPKGKDVSGMSFVSFKIGLDPDMKAKALDPSSWPVGLRFREFIDQQKNFDRRTMPPSSESL